MKKMNNIFVSVLLGAAFVAVASAKSDCPTGKRSNSKLVCYYGDLGLNNACYCTHIVLPASFDVKSIEKARSGVKGAKIYISVNEFNQGLINLLKDAKVDGLEINLKKLDSKNDITDFISTVKTKIGSDLGIVLAVPAKGDLVAKYFDFKALSKYAELFVLQTNFLGASTNVTFHPSRLSGMWDMQNTDSVVDLVSGLGAPLSKLVITAPVQAFRFKLQNKEYTAPGSPALELNSITREELCRLMQRGKNWTLERDEDQAGPYIFNKNQWIAFEDSKSMDIKAKYARIRGLAGLALKDLAQDGGVKCGYTILEAAYNGLSRQARAPRGAVLHSLEREILENPTKPLDSVQLSPYKISRIVDTEGKIHIVRQDSRTEFKCSRQGYFVHPRSCNRFYRCVKFNQNTEDYNVFEFDCPAGLAFDERVEVCVWPGSLPHGTPCSGSSEIAPVPKERFVCPSEPGYYADPENCRWFFACLDHGKSPLSAYEFRCPFGLAFDGDRLVCEWPWLVPKCAGAFGIGIDTTYGYGTTGYSGKVSGVVPAGLILQNYDGLGALGTVKLGGLSGHIEKPISTVYSNVDGSILGSGYKNDGGYITGNGLGYNAIQSLQNAGLLKLNNGAGYQFSGQHAQTSAYTDGHGANIHLAGNVNSQNAGAYETYGQSGGAAYDTAGQYYAGTDAAGAGYSGNSGAISSQSFTQYHGNADGQVNADLYKASLANGQYVNKHDSLHGTTYSGNGGFTTSQNFGGQYHGEGDHSSTGAGSATYSQDLSSQNIHGQLQYQAQDGHSGVVANAGDYLLNGKLDTGFVKVVDGAAGTGYVAVGVTGADQNSKSGSYSNNVQYHGNSASVGQQNSAGYVAFENDKNSGLNFGQKNIGAGQILTQTEHSGVYGSVAQHNDDSAGFVTVGVDQGSGLNFGQKNVATGQILTQTDHSGIYGSAGQHKDSGAGFVAVGVDQGSGLNFGQKNVATGQILTQTDQSGIYGSAGQDKDRAAGFIAVGVNQASDLNFGQKNIEAGQILTQTDHSGVYGSVGQHNDGSAGFVTVGVDQGSGLNFGQKNVATGQILTQTDHSGIYGSAGQHKDSGAGFVAVGVDQGLNFGQKNIEAGQILTQTDHSGIYSSAGQNNDDSAGFVAVGVDQSSGLNFGNKNTGVGQILTETDHSGLYINGGLQNGESLGHVAIGIDQNSGLNLEQKNIAVGQIYSGAGQQTHSAGYVAVAGDQNSDLDLVHKINRIATQVTHSGSYDNSLGHQDNSAGYVTVGVTGVDQDSKLNLAQQSYSNVAQYQGNAQAHDQFNSAGYVTAGGINNQISGLGQKTVTQFENQAGVVGFEARENLDANAQYAYGSKYSAEEAAGVKYSPASGDGGVSSQSFVQYHGSEGGKIITSSKSAGINQYRGNVKYNSGIAGNVNIVGGGYSAVGSVSGIHVTNNGETDDIKTVSYSSTPSPVTVTTFASGPSVSSIPAVTSVPVPGIKTSVGFETFKGGVIANVPELQYKVKSHSDLGLLNISSGFANVVVTTPGYRQDHTSQGAYVYDKPLNNIQISTARPFVTVSTEEPKLYISSTLKPATIVENYVKDDLSYSTYKPNVNINTAVSSNSFQKYNRNRGYKYNKPTVATYTTVSTARPTVVVEEQPQVFVSSTPAAPTVSSYSFSHGAEQANLNKGYVYNKPAVAFEGVPSAPSVISKFSIRNPEVNTGAYYYESEHGREHNVLDTYAQQQPAIVSQYHYQQPTIVQPVQPVVPLVKQPELLSTYTYQQPTYKDQTSYNFKDIALEAVGVSQTPQPKPSYQSGEGRSYQYIKLDNNAKQQSLNVQNEGYIYQTPAVLKEQPQVIVSSTPLPHVALKQQRVKYNYPKPSIKFEETPIAPTKPAVVTSYFNIDTKPQIVSQEEKVGYSYPKPEIKFETPSQPAQVTSYFNIETKPQVQISQEEKVGYSYPKPEIKFETPSQPAQVTSYFNMETKPQVQISQEEKVGYSYPKPEIKFETSSQPAQVTSYFNIETKPQVQISQEEKVGYSYPKPEIKFETPSQPAQVTSYFNIETKPQVQISQEEKVGYSYPKPEIKFETPSQPAQVTSYFNIETNPQVQISQEEKVGYSYPKPEIKFETPSQPAQVTSYFNIETKPHIQTSQEENVEFNYHQPEIKFETPSQPAQVTSYFNIQTKPQAPRVQKVGYKYTKPEIKFEEIPIISTTSKPFRPAVTNSYFSISSSTEKPAVILEQENIGYTYPKPTVKFEETPVTFSTPKPVVVVQQPTPQPAVVTSFFNIGSKTPAPEVYVKEQNLGYTYDQPAIKFEQTPVTYSSPKPAIINYNYLSSTTPQPDIVVEEKEQIQYNLVPSTPRPVTIEEYKPAVVTSYFNIKQSEGAKGYRYPKPTVAFEEGAQITNYNNQEIHEEPFVQKTAYVTGRYDQNEEAHYQQSGQFSVEGYEFPEHERVKQVVFGEKIQYRQPEIAVQYVQSTPKPSFVTTVQAIASKKFKPVTPATVTVYDSRFSSTPASYVSSTLVPEVNIISSTARPISKYSFSSNDDEYQYNEYIDLVKSTTPQPGRTYLPVTSTVRVTSALPRLTKTKVVEAYVAPEVTTAGQVYLPVQTPTTDYLSTKTYSPIRQRVRVTSTTTAPIVTPIVKVPLRQRVRVTTAAPFESTKLYSPVTIIKQNDAHPLLSAKLGAQCTCVSNTLKLRKNQKIIIVEDDSEDDDNDDGYLVDNAGLGKVIETSYSSTPESVVEITPTPEVYVAGSRSLAPKGYGIRKRVKVRPYNPVTELSEIFLKKDVTLAEDEVSDREIAKAVRTSLKLVKQAAKEGAIEGTHEALTKPFDRYGPGGVRSREETLQGTIDCQRAGLFRHPTECNKFYACRWDCTKNRFTLHVFNCPVHLTFDNSLGACNWPSQGPACVANTLITSDTTAPRAVVLERVKVTSTSAAPIITPIVKVLVRQRVRVTTPAPFESTKLYSPVTIIKQNDAHPLLSAKLGAQCTCVSNTLKLRKNQNIIIVEDDSEDDDNDDGYLVDNTGLGKVIETSYSSTPESVVEITPTPEVYVAGSRSLAPKGYGIRKRVKVRPYNPVTELSEIFLKKDVTLAEDEVSDREIAKAVRTSLKLVKQAAKEGAIEGTHEALTKPFDRYGPGGVRSREETLQGTIDCQRAGLFRHPTECNKFYAYRWDCTKNRFTLHVFNCPVHLTFDNSLGACNWPSQGPACVANTLITSD